MGVACEELLSVAMTALAFDTLALVQWSSNSTQLNSTQYCDCICSFYDFPWDIIAKVCMYVCMSDQKLRYVGWVSASMLWLSSVQDQPI